MMYCDINTLVKKNERITTEIFIDRSKSKFGDKFSYDCTIYKLATEKVLIRCKLHGVFSILPNNHMKGSGGCKKCISDSKLKSSKDCISDFKSVHGDKYDYSKFVYKKAKMKSVIICKIHGEFLQTYDHHFRRKQGCPNCVKNRKLTMDIMLELFKEIHGDRYDYSLITKFKSNKDFINIRCKDHGVFRQVINSHLLGRKCKLCAIEDSRLSREDVIKSFIETHGYYYDYSNVDYTNSGDKVEIICPYHGPFMQRPSAHKFGRGCSKCSMKAGHDRKSYINSCRKHDGLSKLYIIEMSSGDEIFYKVGISYMGVKGRFRKRDRDLYDIKTVIEIQMEASMVWDLETQIHRLMHKHKYIPKNKFAGMYECFSKIDKDILKMVKHIGDSNQMQLIT